MSAQPVFRRELKYRVSPMQRELLLCRLRVALRPGFLCVNEHPIPGKPGVLKAVSYFLAEYADQPIRAQASELLSAGLYAYDEALPLFRYENSRRILKKAYEFLAINKE